MRVALTVLALWAAGLGAAAQFGKISVLFDLLSARYAGHSGVAIGLMVSVVGMVGLIFGTSAGILVGRIGPKRAILGAMVLGASVSAAQSVLPGYAVMMASRVLEGFSHLAIVVVGPTMIAGVTPLRHQGLAMTLWSSFFGVTFAALALFAPAFVGAYGPGALFLAHSGWMIAVGAALWLLLPRDPVVNRIVGGAGLIAQHLTIYASPRMAAPAMGFVCYTTIYVALLTLLPPLVPPDWVAVVAIGMPLVSIVVSLTVGVWLLSIYSAVQIVQGGFVAAVLGTMGLWAVWGHGAGEAGFALVIAAALGVVQGASFAAIPQLNGPAGDRAGAAGAVAQLGNLGTTMGTPVMALLIGVSGVTGLAGFIIGLSILGVAIHAIQARRRLIG